MMEGAGDVGFNGIDKRFGGGISVDLSKTRGGGGK